LLALLLALCGAGLAAYKVQQLGLPLTPGTEAPVWTVEARVSLEGEGRAAKADLVLPRKPPGFWILDEDYISGSFGLTAEQSRGERYARWAIRRATGEKFLYYRVTLFQDPEANRERRGAVPSFPPKPDLPEPKKSAVEAVLDDVRAESADIATFTRELLERLNNESGDEHVEVLRDSAPDPREWASLQAEILAGARIPSRLVWGLHLAEGMRHGKLAPILEVHNGTEWLAFDPNSGRRGFPRHFLTWYSGERELLEVSGAENARTEFSVSARVSDLVSVARQRAETIGSRVLDFSLLVLPVAVQNTYRILLTVPLGIALVVILRNVVGVQTFGTFMPVLIALAFRETRLVWGVILLVVLMSLGLLIRSYLARLKLLLVPRLASVVIIVILLMLTLSILSQHLGLERGLSIALFPMVILAMTIERMSIVWEEHGASDALIQGVGTIVVACLSYVVMQDRVLQYLVFVFPELLLVLLAVTLLLGRYKGYRLNEFWRFRAALSGPSDGESEK
jgi:hypothetical protein